ncbi:Topoisomerase 1-associated factor 1 [Psilocybe cubensis]|uniref:Topoisomerase 1-associated factor 1 n=2 Tax=Psilocybe cubensis TaxID=181762 RepID=A0ACB8GHL1_PSICU|nr:Topoisomerase 1-associated factor 1 [Psilocybe cubensis]KAH9474545.1 Topoisomerase 1-associated factor 1 [Psilocybe cubensis]
MQQEVIELFFSDDEDRRDDEDPYLDRRALLEPVVGRVVDALGGREGGVYVMGDQVSGCLKDLKKLWRKDDTDDERTVARLFWEMRVLPNDLVPILLETAGKGLVEDKRAISCIDLITAMTWPIDMAEELKELDEELDKGTDYTALLQSHLHYKAALLQPGVIQAVFGIILPPLAKGIRERVERDGQVINVALHLIRNLAFIKDLPSNSHLSSDQAEFSNLQSKLIRSLSETHIIDLILTIAANTDNDPLFNSWNTLVLEILYLLFRGVKPNTLAVDHLKQSKDNLQRLLALEDRTRRDLSRKATSRHSRFGTTISVKLNPDKQTARLADGNAADAQPTASTSRSMVLHRQQAIYNDSGTVLDMAKRQKNKRLNKADDLGVETVLSMEARVILQELATEFLGSCFNPFLSTLLKDIRSERPKITEKDNLRLLYVTKWFLEFFLFMRSKEKHDKAAEDKWNFGLVAEVTERSWIIWVLKRMREAVEEKPKLWNELQAGIECLTQLLLLIDKMSSSEITDPTLQEAAEVLQQQLVYNGEVLDIALESLKSYKPGTQSLAYLDSSVYLAYALLRMLERWGKEKGNETYVRQKVTKKRRKKGITEEDGIPDVEEEEEVVDDVITETLFTFEVFEAKFAQSEITHTLLTYLERYREFSSSENMRRVVSLLHRQAIKAKAEGLFFKVSTLDLFKTILADQKSLPREQPYKDLINLVNFILRQFFKALEKDPFLAVEAFFPKNRGNWKQYSSWEPEEKSKKSKNVVDDKRFPPDVVVKKGFSWSDQLGIAISVLVEAGEADLVKWTTQILSLVISRRHRIVEETDNKGDDNATVEHDDVDSSAQRHKPPSDEALAKFTDYLIPYTSDEQADAATNNPNLKLLFRLSKFYILDQDSDELEWYIPSTIETDELQRIHNVINQFLDTPFDLDGKKASELLQKKRRRRRRRSPSPDSDNAAVLSGDERRSKKRKEKKMKEKEQYKSAQFIEDSDEEYGNMEAFLEKEKLQRQKAVLAAEAEGLNRPPTMKASGTKKRRRKNMEGSKAKKRKGDVSSARSSGADNSDDSEVEVVSITHTQPSSSVGNQTPKKTPRIRPRPRPKRLESVLPGSSPIAMSDHDNLPSSPSREQNVEPETLAGRSIRYTKRLILSDDED